MARAMLETYAYGDAVRLNALCTDDRSGAPGRSVIVRDADTMWGTPVFRGVACP